ncbi:MAG: redox-sensing transcriptional repressor Rex [Huintestinicola sp.]
MAKREDISASVIKRLPRYYRFIGGLIKQGEVRISSADLAAKMSLTASQIRQDLNCFGGFGQQGYGYNLAELHSEIGKILGVDRRRKAVLFGAGNLGRAIATHMSFEKYGFVLCGIFDSDSEKTGMEISSVKVRSMEELDGFLTEEKPEMAILCIPKAAAQELADRLVGHGVKSFWNFSHYDLSVDHSGIAVENVHLGDSLMLLSYGLTNL